MRCKRLTTAASLMLLVLTAACTSSGGASNEPDILIAASLERTGSGQPVGTAYERALTLAVDRINSSGSLNRRVKLTISDNRTESATTLTQVTQFAANPDVTAIITGSCSECATAVSKVVEDRGVPLISLAPSVSLTVASQPSKFMFKLGPNAVDNAQALIGEMARSGVKAVGLLTPDDAYGKDGQAAMTAAVTKAGMTIKATADFHSGETDFGQRARGVVSVDPDAVVVWAFPTQANLIAAALRGAGYTGKVFMDASAAGDLFLTGPAAAVDGATMVYVPTLAVDDMIATTPAKAERKQWFEDYTSRYGVYQGPSSFAADAVQLIVDAVNRGHSTARQSIRMSLETVRVDGLSGPIRMAPNNHSGLMPQALTVLVARDGRWRLIG